MNPQQMQPTSPQSQTPQTMGQFPNQDNLETKANSAAASLAFAIHLTTQMMQHQAPQTAPQTAQGAPGQENGQETGKDTTDENKPDLAKELSSFKIEIEGMIKSQIGDLKREIQTAIADDENKDTKDEQKEPQQNS